MGTGTGRPIECKAGPFKASGPVQPLQEVEFSGISQDVSRQPLARYPVCFQLGVASGGHNQGAWIGAPGPPQELPCLESGLGRYRATVDDIDVSAFTKRHDPIARLLQDLQKIGGFILVYLAAKCFNRNGRRAVRVLHSMRAVCVLVIVKSHAREGHKRAVFDPQWHETGAE